MTLVTCRRDEPLHAALTTVLLRLLAEQAGGFTATNRYLRSGSIYKNSTTYTVIMIGSTGDQHRTKQIIYSISNMSTTAAINQHGIS